MSFALKAVALAWRFTQTVKRLTSFQGTSKSQLAGTLETSESLHPGTLETGKFLDFYKFATRRFPKYRRVATRQFPRYRWVVLLFVWKNIRGDLNLWASQLCHL